jgi:hypothetical protein
MRQQVGECSVRSGDDLAHTLQEYVVTDLLEFRKRRHASSYTLDLRSRRMRERARSR